MPASTIDHSAVVLASHHKSASVLARQFGCSVNTIESILRRHRLREREIAGGVADLPIKGRVGGSEIGTAMVARQMVSVFNARASLEDINRRMVEFEERLNSSVDLDDSRQVANVIRLMDSRRALNDSAMRTLEVLTNAEDVAKRQSAIEYVITHIDEVVQRKFYSRYKISPKNTISIRDMFIAELKRNNSTMASQVYAEEFARLDGAYDDYVGDDDECIES